MNKRLCHHQYSNVSKGWHIYCKVNAGVIATPCICRHWNYSAKECQFYQKPLTTDSKKL